MIKIVHEYQVHFAIMRKKNHAIKHLITYVIFKSVISLLKINLNYPYSGKQIYIGIRIQNDWILQVFKLCMLFHILWRLFTAQLFKSHRFFMPAFMLHKCTHALNYLLLKFVYKKTLFTYNNGLEMGVSLFSFNFVFMWYFFNLHRKHLLLWIQGT